jgi:hypothetical protein
MGDSRGLYTDGLGQSPIEIGIPMDDDFDDENTPLAGWEEKIVDLLVPGDSGILYYLYDFGDSWQHTVELEEVLPYEKGIKYPKCIAGERNGPIEDCGGVPGYAGLVEILLDPTNPEYKDTAEWADSMKGCTFCPETFNPSKVKFSNPGPRLKRLLENI